MPFELIDLSLGFPVVITLSEGGLVLTLQNENHLIWNEEEDNTDHIFDVVQKSFGNHVLDKVIELMKIMEDTMIAERECKTPARLH